MVYGVGGMVDAISHRTMTSCVCCTRLLRRLSRRAATMEAIEEYSIQCYRRCPMLSFIRTDFRNIVYISLMISAILVVRAERMAIGLDWRVSHGYSIIIFRLNSYEAIRILFVV